MFCKRYDRSGEQLRMKT